MTRHLEPAPGQTVDLNADLGEDVTDDAALLRVVTSANVACGYHAGGPETMRQVCADAVGIGVSVGAQVSYADREHFGRVPRDVRPDVLREQVADQVGTLSDIAAAAGTAVRYLKPHGALYHRVLDDEEQAAAVLAGSGTLPVLGMPGALLRRAAAAGRRVLLEGFPDRGYAADGRLLPRDRPGALVEGAGAVAAQALRLLEPRLLEPRSSGVWASASGPAPAGRLDSLCVHGDSPGAVENAQAVRAALEAAGWVLRGL